MPNSGFYYLPIATDRTVAGNPGIAGIDAGNQKSVGKFIITRILWGAIIVAVRCFYFHKQHTIIRAGWWWIDHNGCCTAGVRHILNDHIEWSVGNQKWPLRIRHAVLPIVARRLYPSWPRIIHGLNGEIKSEEIIFWIKRSIVIVALIIAGRSRDQTLIGASFRCGNRQFSSTFFVCVIDKGQCHIAATDGVRAKTYRLIISTVCTIIGGPTRRCICTTQNNLEGVSIITRVGRCAIIITLHIGVGSFQNFTLVGTSWRCVHG